LPTLLLGFCPFNIPERENMIDVELMDVKQGIYIL
jgi:hypothetical protein